jgi:hypothetical protein
LERRFCVILQPQLYCLRIKSAVTPGNLSQWKPQCVCPAAYCKSGPV